MGKLPRILTDFILDLVEIIFVSLAISALVFLFLGQPLIVSGNSMVPTYEDGEQLIVEKVTIKYNDLKRGEVIIHEHPEAETTTYVIKRIVGLPNETIKFSQGKVFINGIELSEDYLPFNEETIGFGEVPDNVEFKIPRNSYVLLGDNRDNSADSRKWGPIHKSKIIGRSFLVYYPLNRLRITLE